MEFLKKIISSSLILAFVCSLGAQALKPSIALAAAGEGSATINIGTGGTSANSATFGGFSASGTVTVGTLSYVRVALTIGASHIASAQNNITIQVPTNLFPTTSFDTAAEANNTAVDAVGEWTVTYADFGGTDNTAISFAASAATNTGLITIQANQQMDEGDVLGIWFAVNGRYANTAAGLDLKTDDTGADNLTTITAPPTLTSSAADAAASVTLGTNSRANVAGTTTLNITPPFALDADDTIDITFPVNINVINVGSAVTGTLESSDSITCAASGQVVTCTTSAATNASGTIIMTGITALYSGVTDVTLVEVEDEGIAANDIATDSSVAMTNVTNGGASVVEAYTYSIEITSPTAEDDYISGEDIQITWSTSGTGGTSYVTLSSSTDAGTTWEVITTNTINDGSYTWTAPDLNGTIIIKAEGTDLALSLSSDESESFTVSTSETTEAEENEEPATEEEINLEENTYVKGESWNTVYMIGESGMRHPFLDSQTYFTYSDTFNDVVEISDEALASYPMGAPMLPQAGTVLIKIQSVNSVYVLEEDSILRWITSESIAETLYGNTWADYVIDIPVTAWAHFQQGEDIESSTEITVDTSLLKTREELSQ